MGLIDIIKPLSTLLSSAVNKSQQHQEKNSREHRESNPRLLGEKQVCYPCAMQPLPSLCLCWTGIFGKLDQARKVGCCCFGEIYFPLVFPTSSFFAILETQLDERPLQLFIHRHNRFPTWLLPLQLDWRVFRELDTLTPGTIFLHRLLVMSHRALVIPWAYDHMAMEPEDPYKSLRRVHGV